MKNKYKFLVFDVDMTVTESCSVITNEIAEVLNNLNEKLIFLSGTNAKELKRRISSKLKREHYILANAGTHHLLVSPEGEKELYNKPLKEEEKEEIISALKKLNEKYNIISLTTEEDQIQDRGSQITSSLLGKNAPRDKKEAYDSDKKKRTEFVQFLKTILGEEKYEFGIGGTTSIDITEKGNDKGIALEKFAKEKNLSKEDFLFFGDQMRPGGNDFPVIKTGIKCIEVTGPEETLKILRGFL